MNPISEKGPEPPSGLSRAARVRWREQIAALAGAGRLTAARVELVGAWATAIDLRDRAAAQWEEHGRPVEQPGRSGQPRPHHLKVSLERAEAALTSLTAKVERSGARKEPRRPEGLPIGARHVEIDGEPRVIGEDGRLLMRSVADGRWMLDAFESDHDHGALLRWIDPEDSLPRFHDPPPSVFRDGRATVPTRDEVTEWARRRGIPEAAALEWRELERPVSRLLLRDGEDIAGRGL
jgi:hypothetical protein